MILKAYLEQFRVSDRIVFAERCGTSYSHIRNISYGYKPCAAALAIQIEKWSDGQVKCESLRPDIEWSVVRGTRRKSA